MFFIGIMFSLIAMVSGGMLMQKGNFLGIIGIIGGIAIFVLLFIASSIRRQGRRSNCSFLDFLAWSCIGDLACDALECGSCEALECIGADSCG